MAGDWIKVEMATPDKPEVIRAARILGEDRDAVFGKLMRVWMWFDRNSVDGHVDGVVSTDVDALVALPGFCDALQRVGWIGFDNEQEKVWLPNFSRHNGKTSKDRVLRNRRQSSWRANVDGHVDGHVDTPPSTKASTREEKRRDSVYRESADRPSLVEVQGYASTIGLAAWKAEDWFNEMEAVGWIDHLKRDVRNWQRLLDRVRTKWEADGRPKGPPSSRSTCNGRPAGLNNVDRIALTRRTEEIRNRLREISDEMDYETSDRQKLREERASLQNEQKAIKAKLDKANKELLST